MVVYHLQGETGWSTVCASDKQNLLNGKIHAPFAKWRHLPNGEHSVESGTSLTIGSGPGTGRKL